MSELDVTTLLGKLSASGTTLAHTYHHGRIYKTDDNARDIEKLKQIRMISPDIRDAYRLRASLRQFLNTSLNTERLFAAGANIGGYFTRLVQLVDEHSRAFQEARDADCARYEDEAREAISDIADAIEDELLLLQAQVATRFAAVRTLEEKKRQNLHYQDRTQQLVELLGAFHFSDIQEQVQGHDELALSLKTLLSDRVPVFREQLMSVLEVLNQYLFEFRRIEARAKQVRSIDLFLRRHPEWEPPELDEAAHPEEWLQCAAPLSLAGYPDVLSAEAEAALIEVARTIPAEAEARAQPVRQVGKLLDLEGTTIIKLPASPLRRAVRAYFKEASAEEQGISAVAWWAAHPSILPDIQENIWLLRVLLENDNKRTLGLWHFQEVSRPNPAFSGNVIIRDAIVSRKRS